VRWLIIVENYSSLGLLRGCLGSAINTADTYVQAERMSLPDRTTRVVCCLRLADYRL